MLLQIGPEMHQCLSMRMESILPNNLIQYLLTKDK